jgi:hypothetical protein
VSRDVVFDEQAQWNWKKEDGAEAEIEQSFTIDYSVTREPTVIEHTAEENGRGAMLSIVLFLWQEMVIMA